MEGMGAPDARSQAGNDAASSRRSGQITEVVDDPNRPPLCVFRTDSLCVFRTTDVLWIGLKPPS
jgi:hypothetical protein